MKSQVTLTYSGDKLIELRSEAVVPSTIDFAEFTRAVEEQRQIQAELEAHQTNNRRRSSVHGNRPKFQFKQKARQPKHEVKKDEDGWVTFNKKRTSFGAEEVLQHREQFRQEVKDVSINKIRPNSKKMSSAANGGAADLLAEKPKSKFNAFAALNSEDEESD